MVCEYEYNDETQRMRVNCLGCVYGSSHEDFDICMAQTISKLMELKRIPSRIVLAREREYEYDFSESKMLFEIAAAITKIQTEKIVSLSNVIVNQQCDKCVPNRYAFLQRVMAEIKFDPIGAYKQVVREIRHINILQKKLAEGVLPNPETLLVDNLELCNDCFDHYMGRALIPIRDILETCRLIQLSKEMEGLEGREIYRRIFHPTIRPNFMYTSYVSIPPANVDLIERYNIGNTQVEIYQAPGKVRKLYHVIPPEFRLNENEYMLLDTARRYLGKHEPKETELSEPTRFRENIFNIGIDMLRDLSKSMNIPIGEKKLREMADILARYTAGLGTLEIFLADEKIQDIAINSPIGSTPVYIFHADHEECETNIIPSMDDADSWATRFRLQSGRPLDEANPVLDTEIVVPGGRARVAAITRTLSPDGLGFALRRHRDRPWTFPLFIKNKMFDAFSAGLLWFVVDGARTLLIAGTRSSGKTSFLGSCMVQIMPKLRTITVEDTLELPVTQLRELGYNIQRLKSRSVITHVEIEIAADEALRTALRLGDSCLIIGEVRSLEAKALYEAMRIGALANVVAGTIHGESAYGVFDRVVNDLGVPATSFKATDLIVVCNSLKSPDGMHTFRRVTGMTEVRKHWKSDPMEEGGFENLMEYSAKDDVLKPSKTLLMGESQILNDIASRTREWRADWEAIWNNINLRAKIMQSIVDYSPKREEILEATFLMQSNAMFHIISAAVRSETGTMDNTMIYDRWFEWFRNKIGV